MSKDIRTAFGKGKEKSSNTAVTEDKSAEPVTLLNSLGTPVIPATKRLNTELSPPSPAMDDSIVSRINSMIDSKTKIWGKQLNSLKVDVIKANSDKMTEIQKALSIEIDSKLDSAKKEISAVCILPNFKFNIPKSNPFYMTAVFDGHCKRFYAENKKIWAQRISLTT